MVPRGMVIILVLVIKVPVRSETTFSIRSSFENNLDKKIKHFFKGNTKSERFKKGQIFFVLGHFDAKRKIVYFYLYYYLF